MASFVEAACCPPVVKVSMREALLAARKPVKDAYFWVRCQLPRDTQPHRYIGRVVESLGGGFWQVFVEGQHVALTEEQFRCRVSDADPVMHQVEPEPVAEPSLGELLEKALAELGLTATRLEV